jgi:hypothetical protein
MRKFRTSDETMTRRRVVTGGAALAAGSAAIVAGAAPAGASAPWSDSTAILEIEYLRRRYGQASDLLGPGSDRRDDLSLAERRTLGRKIYRQIFTPDARIVAGGGAPVIGPDAWADAVTRSNGSFSATQHLLGTQLVTLEGRKQAQMQSYLNALLEFSPGGNVLVVRGTYFDKVRLTEDAGWQIHDMNLVIASIEQRNH